MKEKKIKINVLLKHVDLITEGLANLNKPPKLSKKKGSIFIQVLIIAAFLSFIHDTGLELEPLEETQ